MNVKFVKNVFLILSISVLLPLLVYGQDSEIVLDKNAYTHLVGKKYVEVNELGFLEFQGRSGTTHPDGSASGCTQIMLDGKTLILWELVTANSLTQEKSYEIKDVLYLDGRFSHCGGCFLINKPNVTIESFHQLGEITQENVLLTVEFNEATGKIEVISSEGLTWQNPR